MININVLVNHVKARLGTSVRNIELSDDAIISILQQETLLTFSTYMPFYCLYNLELEKAAIQPLANTYRVPEEVEGFKVLEVQSVIPAFSGVAASAYSFAPMGSDLTSIISMMASTRTANTMASAIMPPETWQWIPPSMLRLYTRYTMANVNLLLKTTHKEDFTTVPLGAVETLKKLALYDVALDIYGIRKHFSNINTMVAQIELDMDFFQSVPDKRDELVERMRKEQLKYGPTKKIYIA